MSEWIGLASSILVGGTLAYAGFIKLRQRREFLSALERYRFLPAPARPTLSLAIPVLEVVLGVLLVVGLGHGYAAFGAMLLLAGFTLGLVATVGWKGRSDCGCFGSAGETANSLLMGRNLSLLILALVAWTARGDLVAPGQTALLAAFAGATLALVASLTLTWRPAAADAKAVTVSEDRRRFLKLASSGVAGLVAAVSLGVLERRNAEAACYGCGTCGTDYVFLYCTSPCCAAYWVRPYNYCETSCPSCSASVKTYCGISACC